MKLYLNGETALRYLEPARTEAGVWGETDRLTDVLLCAPSQLKPVPCCSVTRESLRKGFTGSPARAVEQHRALCEALAQHGVRCHFVPPAPGLPDLCFTRDALATTPWGLVGLSPATDHRRLEVDHLLAFAEGCSAGGAGRIEHGHIEGGDICIAREGLLIIGVSGERTDERGARAFAQRFRDAGWDVLLCDFDPHFLHLDTIFCMINPHLALACVDVLDDDFLAALACRGIDLLPVTYKESRKLGCNILSVDGASVIAGAATPRVAATMRDAGIAVTEVDVSELAACGGGVHCLTMPLRRAPTLAASLGEPRMQRERLLEDS